MPWFPASPIWVSSSIRRGWPYCIPIRKPPCPLDSRRIGSFVGRHFPGGPGLPPEMPLSLGWLAVVCGNARARDRPGAGRRPGDGRPLHVLDPDRVVCGRGLDGHARQQVMALSDWVCGSERGVGFGGPDGLCMAADVLLADSETLWTHALACTSRNSIAHTKFANVLAGRGQLDAAIDHYREALEITPDFADARNNFGPPWYAAGRSTRPSPSTGRPWKSGPTLRRPTTILGWFYRRRGDLRRLSNISWRPSAWPDAERPGPGQGYPGPNSPPPAGRPGRKQELTAKTADSTTRAPSTHGRGRGLPNGGIPTG